MDQYVLGWLHAMVIIFVIAIVLGLVLIKIKIIELTKLTEKLEKRIESDLADVMNNFQEINQEICSKEDAIFRQIEIETNNLTKDFESTIDSRVNKLENKIAT